MPSSPTGAAGVTLEPAFLREVTEHIPDPRAARGIRHSFTAILTASIAAVLAGARSYTAISEWVDEAGEKVRSQLGMVGVSWPSESTIRRVLNRIDTDLFDAVIGAYLWTRTATCGGRRIIAVDGKTIRGARTATTGAPHLVAALDHTSRVVLGQRQVADKTNEIPCEVLGAS